MHLRDLLSSDVESLERLFVEAPPALPERACFRGHHLLRLSHPSASKRRYRWLQNVSFKWTPFGIDFRHNVWYFFHRRLRTGRFREQLGPSRWRDTEAVGLWYDPSRLPGPVTGALYDEVKPLSDRLCLAIGGINGERGQGDHFFFALEREPTSR